jgi:hypothetical protein
MGNTQNTQLNEEERILEQPQQGEASEFYWACRNGDLGRVRQLLNSIPYGSLNRLELNGSTTLHAASYYGHREIVRLLLHQRGCRSERLNRHGLTAYQEAKNDEIRQLFHRPGNKNRFSDGNEQSAGDILRVDTGEGEDEFKKDKWLEGMSEPAEIEKYRLLVAELKKVLNPPAYVKIVRSVFGSDGAKDDEAFNRMIDQHVTQQHPEYEKCKVGQGSKRATKKWPGPARPNVARVFLGPSRPDSALAQPDPARPGDFKGPGPGPRDISFREFFLAYRIRRSLR